MVASRSPVSKLLGKILKRRKMWQNVKFVLNEILAKLYNTSRHLKTAVTSSSSRSVRRFGLLVMFVQTRTWDLFLWINMFVHAYLHLCYYFTPFPTIKLLWFWVLYGSERDLCHDKNALKERNRFAAIIVLNYYMYTQLCRKRKRKKSSTCKACSIIHIYLYCKRALHKI